MATGDLGNMAYRLKKLLPPSWFPDPSPTLWAVLQGFGNVAAYIYAQIAFAQLQTRIATATGFFLDLIAFDFFGRTFQRAKNLSDAAFRTAIVKEILRAKGTRAGLIQALIDLTGRAPVVFEPTRPADTGGYGIACGYGVAGAYGSMLMPYQALVIAYRPASTGIPGVDGYGGSIGGYGSGAIKYADLGDIIAGVTDAQIYARIDSVKPVGTIIWTAIKS